MPNPSLHYERGPQTLMAFRRVETLWEGLTAEELFVINLFVNSNKRRLAKGHDGLMLEAANDVIDFGVPYLEQIYEREGFNLSLAQDWRSDLAENIVRECSANKGVKTLVARLLREVRTEVFNDPALTLNDPHIGVFGPNLCETDKRKFIEKVGENVFSNRFLEEPIVTFNRTLDYIDHLKCGTEHKSLFSLKYVLTSLARVHNCIAALG